MIVPSAPCLAGGHTRQMAPPLEPCPSRPNCVSSLAEKKSQFVEAFQSHGDIAEALSRLALIIGGYPRTTIEVLSGTHLHAVFRSAVFRFADDLEFMADVGVNPPVLHVRSASRLGYSDLGVNRKRVEKLREAFEASYETTESG